MVSANEENQHKFLKSFLMELGDLQHTIQFDDTITFTLNHICIHCWMILFCAENIYGFIWVKFRIPFGLDRNRILTLIGRGVDETEWKNQNKQHLYRSWFDTWSLHVIIQPEPSKLVIDCRLRRLHFDDFNSEIYFSTRLCLAISTNKRQHFPSLLLNHILFV